MKNETKEKDGNEKKKITIKRVISTLLIVGGIALIVVPFGIRAVNIRNQEKMLEDFYLELEVSDADALEAESSLLDDALEWGTQVENQEEITANSEEADATTATDLEDAGVLKAMPKIIGAITIDKIDLTAPIGEGFSLDVLKFTIGHLPESAGLGEIGNTVLAGHRSHTFGVYFNRLDEVEIGDEIIVTASDGSVHTYEVYEKYIVEPDDISPMRGSSSHSVLTLITCHPPIVADQRLIVHAIEKTDE